MAPYAARLIIAAELIIGLQLCVQRNLRLLYIPAAIFMLSVFSIYLSFTIITNGVGANCGCFGELLPMSTSSALIKNIILIIILIYSFKTINDDKKTGFTYHISAATVITLLIFIIFPLKVYEVPQENKAIIIKADTLKKETAPVNAKPDSSKEKDKSKKSIDSVISKTEKKFNFLEKLEKTSSVYAKFTSFSGKNINPDEGEKIVAVFSLDCEHCMAVSKELSSVKNKFPLPQVLVLFLGSEDQVAGFYGDGFKFPYQIIEPVRFFPLLKKAPPRISYLVNGNIIGNWVEEDFSEKNLLDKIRETRGGK